MGSLVGIVLNIVLPGKETIYSVDGTMVEGDEQLAAHSDELPLEGPTMAEGERAQK